jgi:hypothetical protein
VHAGPARATGRPATAKRWADLTRALERQQGERVAWVVLAIAMAAFAGLSLWLMRGTSFFYDELSWFAMSRGADPQAILTPHNGNLIAGTRVIYAAGLELFGTSYIPYRLVSIASVIAATALLYVFVKRRIGPLAALAPAIVVLFLGSGADTILAPVGISSLHSAIAGLGALIALDRRDLPGDIVACGLLVLAAASFTVGLAFVAGAAVWVLLEPDRWRRAWIFAVPLVLYAAWSAWALQFDQTRILLANIPIIPGYVADAFASGAGSLTGLNYVPDTETPFAVDLGWGRVVAALAVVALGIRMLHGPMPRAFWALLAIPLAFWIAGALTSTSLSLPDSTRFVFPSAIGVVVVAAEAARGVRVSARALLILLGVAVFALGANIAHLRDKGQRFRAVSEDTRTRLATVEIARDTVSPDFSYTLFAPVEAGPYLKAVERHGSIAFSAEELNRQTESIRALADSSLAQILGPSLTPIRRPGPLSGCETVASQDGANVVVEPPVGGALLRSPAPAAVRLRRFADEFTVEVGELRGGPWFGALRIPPDAASQPWTAQVATWEPVTVCPIDDASSS